MANKLTAKITVTLNAPTSRVWHAITDPSEIKEYMFGTNTRSDWEKGSTITYSGEWQGKPYEDKGIIVEIVPEKLLHTTYFSYMSGKEDKPENYANVIYELRPEGDHTIFTLTQDNIDNEQQLEHMNQNWGMVLDGLKKLVER